MKWLLHLETYPDVNKIEWNLDLTKSLGTGQICSLNGGLLYRKHRYNEFEGEQAKSSLH